MATIQTSIQLQDNMSRQFAAINMAMSSTIDYMQQLNTASGDMIDTSALDHAQRELRQMESYYAQMEAEIMQAEDAQRDYNRTISHGGSVVRSLLGTIGAVVGAYLSFEGIKKSLGLSDELTNTTARLNLMNDGLTTTLELQKMIYDSAQRTYAPYQATADMVGKLGMQARAAFGDNKEIVDFAEQLNKTFAIAGTSVIGVESVMLQLTQAMAAGKLQGEELNAILDNAQPIVANIQRYLEEAFNMDASNIKKLASDGIITAEIIKNAMFYAAEETNAAFESMPLTWGQIWTKMKNYALDAFSPILLKINEVANSARMQGIMSSITNSLYTIAGATAVAFNLLTSVGAFLYDNWSVMGPIIGGVTAALVANAAAWMWTNREIAVNLFMMATAGARNLWYVATTVASTWATYGFTAAMAALSIAISANPIGWLIGAIIVLVTTFYLAISAVNHFAGTSISATGLITGAFATLAVFIHNAFAFLWNLIGAFFEFIVNIGTNSIYSVKRLFVNLANVGIDMAESLIGSFDSAATNLANMFVSGVNIAIGALNGLIETMNQIPGITLGKVEEFGYKTSVIADYSGLRNKMDNWLGDTPEGYWEAPRMQMKSFPDAFLSGYDWGSNLFSTDSLERNLTQDYEDLAALANLDNIASTLNEIADKAKDTAKNTAATKDKLDISGDDLKYLRDLAERDTINRFTTAEIKVDMSGMNNNINYDTDIDGIVDRFGEKVEEVVAVLAEGDEYDV